MSSLQTPVRLAWIYESILDSIVAEARKVSPRESGGVLMGYWVTEYRELVIAGAVGPGPRAIHDEHRFVPDSEYQYEQIARLYEHSGRLHTYLGDWHSHPDDNFQLSRKDRAVLKRISKYPSARARVPLMGIIVSQPSFRFHIWCYFPRRLQSRWRSRIESLELRICQ